MPNDTSDFDNILLMLDDLVTYDRRLQKDVGFLKSKLGELNLKAKAPGASKEDQAEYHRYMEGLAEGLPALTKGVIGAVQAFKAGDPFGETAAVLEICATLSSTLGALAGPSAGPPGALLGAVFSMVSMILSIWIPKGPELIEQLENLLRQLKAEGKLEKLGTAEVEIRKFVFMVQEVKIDGTPKHTSWEPLDLTAKGYVVQRLEEACQWLMEPNNQAQRLWGEVLAAVSRVFVSLMQAVAISTAKATPESKVEKITEYLRAEWSTHLEFLQKVAPAARNRGMLLYIGTNQAVYAGDNLWGRSFNPLYGYQLRLATAISRADIGKAAPPIQTFCVGTSQDVYHGRLEWSATGLQRSLLTVKDAPLTNCRDIWAAPGDKPEEVCFYTVHVDDVRGYLLGGDNQARFVWSEPIKDRRPASIRVVSLPESIPNDPDGLDQTPPVLNDIDWIVYVGCEASADIFVKASDQRKGYLPIPPSWTSYTGIGIDQTYLWIFRPLEFACVTHTSLIQCLRKNRAQPSWITNFPRQILYSGAEFTGPPGHKGLLDLFPCEDGTLIVAAEQRQWTGPYRGRLPEWDYGDANILAIGDYHTDLASKAMSVTWRTVENNQALKVHKVPLPCWPLIDGTIRSLKRKLAVRVAASERAMTEGSRGGG